MTWDYPALLFSSVSLPLIILLHILSRRRRTLTVPSLLLWDRLLENERRSVSLRRLIADLLLILQLLAALLLVLSLAGLRLSRSAGNISGPTVLALDISAGMSAADEAGITRFEEMTNLAAEMIRTKSAGSEVAVMAGGSDILPVVGFSSSRKDLLRALKTLEKGDEPGNPELLMQAAVLSASVKPGGRVVFITDAAFDGKPETAGITDVIRVGSPSENTGITAFAVRGLPGGGRELLITVDNFGRETRLRQLTVRIDGREVLSEELILSAGGRESRTLSWNDPLAGHVSAELSGGNDDVLSSDDRAFAVLTPGARIRTALVTPGNWFLETLLRTHPNILLTVFPGIEFWREDDREWDLLIADRIYPPADTAIPLLAIYPFTGAAEPPLPLVSQGLVEGTDPVSWDSNHPITRNADLSRVSVRASMSLVPGPGVSVLAESGKGPLISAGITENRRWAAFSFNLLESSLPLRPAFPILISDALSWLVPGDQDSAAESLRTGAHWVLPPEFSGAETEIYDSRGQLFGGDGRVNRVGFWTARNGSSKTETGVSLLNADESDLRPRWEPEETTPLTRPVNRNRTGPVTAAFIVLAFLFVLAEWGFQARYWGST